MLSEELWKPELVVGMEFMKNMQQSAVLDLFCHMPQVMSLPAREGGREERERMVEGERDKGRRREKERGGEGGETENDQKKQKNSWKIKKKKKKKQNRNINGYVQICKHKTTLLKLLMRSLT